MPVPRSVSATALDNARGCKARWYAENYLRSETESGWAATLGSACHDTLEEFVRSCHFVAPHMRTAPTKDHLIMLWNVKYNEHFGAEFDPQAFDEGQEMLMNWWKRDKFGANPRNETPPEVLMLENKLTYVLKSKDGAEVPFNYIFDRLDLVSGTQQDPKEIEVVDYKSIRAPLHPDDLTNKFQARCYALMVQIMYPNVQRIWVTFDLLRHQPVGRVFTRDDQVTTWRILKRLLEEVIAIPEDPDLSKYENLNSDCVWCIRKYQCKALASNVAGGGIESVATLDDAVEIRHKLAAQAKATKEALDKLEARILKMLQEVDSVEYETDGIKLSLSAGKKRGVNTSRVKDIVGVDIFSDYAEEKLLISQFDQLLKDPRIDEATRSVLKGLVFNELGAIRINTKEKNK